VRSRLLYVTFHEFRLSFCAVKRFIDKKKRDGTHERLHIRVLIAQLKKQCKISLFLLQTDQTPVYLKIIFLFNQNFRRLNLLALQCMGIILGCLRSCLQVCRHVITVKGINFLLSSLELLQLKLLTLTIIIPILQLL